MSDALSLDHNAIVESVGGDEELLREIVTLFLADYPRLVAEIRKAIDAGDAPALERAAHTLKSTIMNFEPTSTAELARRLEFLGRDKQLASAPVVAEALEQQLKRLHQALVELAQIEVSGGD